MKFIADIRIMPHKELLDPQGKTVLNNLAHLDVQGVHDIRIGRHVAMILEADSEAAARAVVEETCKKLLANLIVETYDFTLTAQ
ncbi:MAG: phosphoribosylformylglycinamidine synthase subunit PurS [Saprospiraceae bacterium]